MLLARLLMPRAVLEKDFLDSNHAFNNGKTLVIVIVHQVTGFPFACLMAFKVAVGVALVLSDLCLIFGAPVVIRSGVGGEFTAQAPRPLCEWIMHRDRY